MISVPSVGETFDRSVAVVLPAYNEANSLPLLLERLARTDKAMGGRLRVIVVDDGSEDGTASVAEKVGAGVDVQVLVHCQNQGLGGALKTGLLYGSAVGSVVVTMDADNTHDPDLIPSMVEHIEAGADVVVASRFAEGAGQVGVPLHRRVLSGGARMVLGRASGARGVQDYTSGYRAYRTGFINDLVGVHGSDGLVCERSFACQYEVLRKGAALGAVFREVPLMLRFDQKSSPSKMRILDTLRGYARVLTTTSPGRSLEGHRPVTATR